MKLLYLQASPRLVRSHSIAIADAFVEAWGKYNSKATVTLKNLFQEKLPDFDNEAVNARYLAGRGLAMDKEQEAAWASVWKIIEEFKTYVRYVLASPMWNFNVPYKLKQYIDLVFQPAFTFDIIDPSYMQQMESKKICMFLARGAAYPEGSPQDFQTPYLDYIFGLMGFKQMHKIVIEPTVQEAEKVHAMHTAKINEALALAKEF